MVNRGFKGEEEIRILQEEYNVNLEMISNYTQVEIQILSLEPMMTEIKTKFQNILECSSGIYKLINYEKEYEEQLSQIFVNI